MAGTVSGAFATTNLPALTPGLSWAVNYGASSVQLSVSGRPAPATFAAYAAYYGLGAGNVDPDGAGMTNLIRYAVGRVPAGAWTGSASVSEAASGPGVSQITVSNIDKSARVGFIHLRVEGP